MSSVEVSQACPGVTQITLNRPDKLNAMTVGLVRELHETFDTIEADSGTRGVVITGAGRGFCAGLDLGGYSVAPYSENAGSTQRAFAVQKHIASLIPRMRSLRQPIIAAVNGPAAGGGLALVLGSDVRLASRTAKFNA